MYGFVTQELLYFACLVLAEIEVVYGSECARDGFISFVSQGNHGINAGGAAGGQVTCAQRDAKQYTYGDTERQWVTWTNTKEPSFEEPHCC